MARLYHPTSRFVFENRECLSFRESPALFTILIKSRSKPRRTIIYGLKRCFSTAGTGPVSILENRGSTTAMCGEHIHQVSPIPVLLILCLQDSIVSYQHSGRLYEAAKEPKRLWLTDGCSHVAVFTDTQSDSGYGQKLVQFFMDYRKEVR
jgi:hypothetical protein